MNLVKLHGRCGQRFAALVSGVGAQQWHDETPCSEWDVRTLVHHLLDEQLWVPPLFDGLTISEVGDRFEGDLMGHDDATWAGLLATSIEQATRLWRSPTHSSELCTSPSAKPPGKST